ncbi:MAG: hypothetical protein LE178_03850 [Endomicrobium sp.]|nr:hypothetical protein [Endomicrobium sp.]
MALRTIRKKSGRRKSRSVGAGGGVGGGESADGGRGEEDDDEDNVGSVAVKIICLFDVAIWQKWQNAEDRNHYDLCSFIKGTFEKINRYFGLQYMMIRLK